MRKHIFIFLLTFVAAYPLLAQELTLGMYSVPAGGTWDRPINSPQDALGVAKDLGVNTIANPFWYGYVSDSSEFLDTLSRRGLYGLIGFNEDLTKWRRGLDKGFVLDYVNQLKDYPSLGAYVLPDEPYSSGGTKKKIVALYQAIKQADSNHLVIMVDYLEGAAMIHDGYDIFAYDWYPIGNATIAEFRDSFKAIVAAASPKPVWGILQTYADDENYREPTLTELRNMAYVMLANGAKGFLAYMYGCTEDLEWCLYNHNTLMAATQSVYTELASVSTIVSAPDSKASVSASVSGFDFRVKNVSGQSYLIATRWENSSASVKITLSGLSASKVTIVTGSGKDTTISLSSNAFTDSFTAYDAKIYMLQ